jgi:hypothetical protein
MKKLVPTMGPWPTRSTQEDQRQPATTACLPLAEAQKAAEPSRPERPRASALQTCSWQAFRHRQRRTDADADLTRCRHHQSIHPSSSSPMPRMHGHWSVRTQEMDGPKVPAGPLSPPSPSGPGFKQTLPRVGPEPRREEASEPLVAPIAGADTHAQSGPTAMQQGRCDAKATTFVLAYGGQAWTDLACFQTERPPTAHGKPSLSHLPFRFARFTLCTLRLPLCLC